MVNFLRRIRPPTGYDITCPGTGFIYVDLEDRDEVTADSSSEYWLMLDSILCSHPDDNSCFVEGVFSVSAL